MVLIYKTDIEIASPIHVEKLFRAFVVDNENLIPKIAPHVVEKIKNLQGDGGPGSTKKIKFAKEQKYKNTKIEVVTLGKEEFFSKFEVIEGDVLRKLIYKIEVDIKMKVSPEGKSMLKVDFIYFTKHDFELSNEDIEAVKKNSLKAVEAYFLDHPDEECLELQ